MWCALSLHWGVSVLRLVECFSLNLSLLVPPYVQMVVFAPILALAVCVSLESTAVAHYLRYVFYIYKVAASVCPRLSVCVSAFRISQKRAD